MLRILVKTGWALFVCVCVELKGSERRYDVSKLGRCSFSYPLAFLVFSHYSHFHFDHVISVTSQ
jgi:hypothetical protein